MQSFYLPSRTSESDIEIDTHADCIARFLNQYLNTVSNRKVVETYRCYDAFNVPMQGYPLLKVYRNSDELDLNTPVRETSATISYCIISSHLEKLPGLMCWASEQIILGLSKFALEHPGFLNLERRVTARYRTIYQLGQLIYQLDFNLNWRQ